MLIVFADPSGNVQVQKEASPAIDEATITGIFILACRFLYLK